MKITTNWKFENDTITAEISPCSYMNSTLGLQISVILKATGQREFPRKPVDFADATESDAMELVNSIIYTTCKCGNVRIDAEKMGLNSNRGELCETCFIYDLNAQFAIDKAKEDKRLIAYDNKMKAKGYKFKVTAWIHPKRGGDDYQIDYYFMEQPTDEVVQKLLAKKSSITNDYTIKSMADIATV